MSEVVALKTTKQSYEAGELISKILDDCKSISSPFLLFRYPHDQIVLASYEQGSEGAFSFSPFHNDKSIELSNIGLKSMDNISSFVHFPSLDESPFSAQLAPESVDKPLFIRNVLLAKEEIISGTFKKVVLSKTKKIKEVNLVNTFFELEKKYPTALIYCFYHPDCGTWIGASPEKLLEKDEEDKFHIHSLAGTRKINELWTEKEIEEQKIVTEYITDKLRSCGATDIMIEGPLDYKYGSIKHLKSSIHFHSVENMDRIVRTIHPTPAVCGLPLKAAKKFILENEGYDRSYYTGFIGLKNLAKVNDTYFVNLRCMQVTEDNTYIYTGAGIVADSDPENEWEEVEAKSKTLMDCIITHG